MKFKTYVVTSDGRCGATRFFNKSQSVVARARFLQKNNPRTHTIVVVDQPSQRHFFFDCRR